MVEIHPADTAGARKERHMERVARRRFLRQAAFGSGMIPVLAGSSILNGQQLTHSNANANIAMVSGRILNASGTTLVLETRDGARPLSLVGGRIWRHGGASAAQLQTGDFVYARGVQMGDGLFLVTQLWANIVSVRGRVDTIVSSTTMLMQWGPFGAIDSNSGRRTKVTIDAGTIINDGSLASLEKLKSLRSGMRVLVVGTALDESAIHATRLFMWWHRVKRWITFAHLDRCVTVDIVLQGFVNEAEDEHPVEYQKALRRPSVSWFSW
jgi:hypothetical protein